MMMQTKVAAAVFALLVPIMVHAQDAQTLAVFKAINDKEPAPTASTIATEATALLKTMVDRGQAKCMPASVTIDRVAPATATRMAIDGINAGQLKNAWTAYGRLEGCPSQAPSRFIVLRMPDSSLIVRMVNTGETLTTSSQMRGTSSNAALAALVAIRKANPTCAGDGMAMGDTRIVARDADLGPDVFGSRYVGGWQEAWRFSACGVDVDVPIGFKADGTGGVFTNVRGGESTIMAR